MTMSISFAPFFTASAASKALASGVWVPKGKQMTLQGVTSVPSSSFAAYASSSPETSKGRL